MAKASVHSGRESDKWLVITQKSLALFFLLEDGTSFIFLAMRANDNYRLITTGVRTFLWTFAFLLARIRMSKNYYIPSLHEMSERTFWSAVHVILAIHAGFYFYFTYKYSPVISQVQAGTLMFSIFLLISLYQQKPWIKSTREYRVRRIAELRRKAKITQEELSALRPFLIKEAWNHQRPPLFWKLLKWVAVILLGSLLSVYSDIIVNMLQTASFWSFFTGQSIR